MRVLLKLVLFVTFVGGVVWAVSKPGYDSYIAAAAALGALITAFIVEKRREASTSMSQKVAKGGTGIQAGGNVTIKK